MATKIITKNSSTATSIPTAGDLVQGELAVNVTDKRLFTEDSGGAIVELGTNPSTLTSGAATFSGDVGIGTSSPTTALQVGDGTGTANWLRLTGTVSDLYIGQNTALPHFGQTNAAKLISAASYPIALGTANAFPVIFGTNDTERMRIDGASGNLLVGKTASAIGTAGTEIYGTGVITSTRAGNILDLNRLSTPGNIAQFRADGAIVGSIGVKGTDLTIGNTVTGLQFYDAGNALAPVNVTTNANTDGATDLGLAGARFKDLYLSGGVYLGGTGAANKLDDYEEGTWTPTFGSEGTQPTVSTYTNRTGTYTKIGNTVNVRCFLYMSITGAGTGIYTVTGLPFTVADGYPGVAVGISTAFSSYGDVYGLGTRVRFYSASVSVSANRYITFSFTYEV